MQETLQPAHGSKETLHDIMCDTMQRVFPYISQQKVMEAGLQTGCISTTLLTMKTESLLPMTECLSLFSDEVDDSELRYIFIKPTGTDTVFNDKNVTEVQRHITTHYKCQAVILILQPPS